MLDFTREGGSYQDDPETFLTAKSAKNSKNSFASFAPLRLEMVFPIIMQRFPACVEV